jgi:hypothetical protein
MLHPIGLYFLSIIVIGLWCAGFRKTLSYTKTVKRAVVHGQEEPVFTPVYSNQMLLWKLGVKLDAMGFWGKPLGTCIYCMPSVHGTILFTLLSTCLSPLGLYLVVMWPIAVVSSVVTSGYFYGKINHGT